MSAKNKYTTKEEIIMKSRDKEKAICIDAFSKIFKTTRVADKNGDLKVNFELLMAGVFTPGVMEVNKNKKK